MLEVKLGQSFRDLGWVVLAVLISWGFWNWALHILAPVNAAVISAARRPVGNNSDLYPRWLGTRELLLHRRDPYSPEVTREIQTGFYGRPLEPTNPSDPKAEESFVYPLYVVFLLAPTIALPFHRVAVIFCWILLAAVAASVPLWIYVVRLRARWPMMVCAMLLATSSSPAMYEYFQQNLAAIAILFLAAGVAAVVAGRLWLAGVLLALSTIKPDTSGFVVLWLLLWAAANIRERGRLLWTFGVSLGALVIAAAFLSAGWIWHFVSAVRAYPGYGTDLSIIQVLFPGPLALFVTIGLIAWVGVLCWQRRNAVAGSEDFAMPLALVGATTLVILPKLAAYNALLLLPGLLLLIRRHSVGSKHGVVSRAMMKAAFACQIWQWISALLLSIASVLLSVVRIRAAAHVPDLTFFALWPVTLLALLTASEQAARQPNCIEKSVSV